LPSDPQDWLFATVIGLTTGLVLFAFVRLRMHVGPIIRARWGNTMRQAYWLLTIVLMILVANLGLGLLRRTASTDHVMLEIWFITIAVATAFLFIYRRISRNR